MKKVIFCSIMICIISCGSIASKSVKNVPQVKSQSNYESKVLWLPSKKLTWDNFMALPPNDRGITEAITQCEIVISKLELINNIPKIHVETFFIKNKSWSITSDSLALKHEQLHFDIYELFTRKIRKKFNQLNNLKELDIKVYQSHFDKLIDLAIKKNEKYDYEVYFNEEKQREWIDDITKELEDLKEYEYIPKE